MADVSWPALVLCLDSIKTRTLSPIASHVFFFIQFDGPKMRRQKRHNDSKVGKKRRRVMMIG